MYDRRNNLLFNSFIVTIILAHFSQLVWNLPHPLLTEQPPLVGIPPFDPVDDLSSESLTESQSDETGGYEQDQRPYHHQHSDGSNGGNKETREIHGRIPEVGALCSLFQTFLDARNVNCRFANPPRQYPEDIHHEGGVLNDGRNTRNDVTLLDSNNLLPPQQHGDHHHNNNHNHNHGLHPHSHDGEDQADSRIDSLPLSPLPPPIPLDENGNEDETKIIRSKTMIIVPERGCPPGKRRDIRGYCRTIFRYQPYTSPPPRPGPIRFYYRRFVAVPTLHFILP